MFVTAFRIEAYAGTGTFNATISRAYSTGTVSTSVTNASGCYTGFYVSITAGSGTTVYSSAYNGNGSTSYTSKKSTRMLFYVQPYATYNGNTTWGSKQKLIDAMDGPSKVTGKIAPSSLLPKSASFTIPDHSYSEYWDGDDTNHYHVCSKCGAKKDVTKHTFYSYFNHYSIAPTCTADGKGYKACQYCNRLVLMTAPKLGHRYLSWKYSSDTQHKRTCTRCGGAEQYENHTIVNGQCTGCGHYFTATLIFDNNGGSGGPGTVTKQIGSTYVPTPNPSRTGYTFKGWAKK